MAPSRDLKSAVAEGPFKTDLMADGVLVMRAVTAGVAAVFPSMRQVASNVMGCVAQSLIRATSEARVDQDYADEIKT